MFILTMVQEFEVTTIYFEHSSDQFNLILVILKKRNWSVGRNSLFYMAPALFFLWEQNIENMGSENIKN